ncbi:substrate-binding periplasmic protein [Duganella guangzhouensis]|nr:transporter substrate-binding domain-containing protein [Duganella guangzhouensis]
MQKRHLSTRRAVLALMLALSAGSAPAAPREIAAWTYLDSPPYITDPVSNAGLMRDLVDYLNQALAGRYHYTLAVIPRARLNLMLEHGERGVVLLAPSVVFDGPYLRSDALLDDRQELLSRKDQPIEYHGAGSLNQINLGGMRGHSYPFIQADIDAGRVHVHRAQSEAALLKMLMAKRLDAVTMAGTSAHYLAKISPEAQAGLHYSQTNLGRFSRQLMFQAGMQTERDAVNSVVRAMADDPVWRATLARYGLQPAARLHQAGGAPEHPLNRQ